MPHYHYKVGQAVIGQLGIYIVNLYHMVRLSMQNVGAWTGHWFLGEVLRLNSNSHRGRHIEDASTT